MLEASLRAETIGQVAPYPLKMGANIGVRLALDFSSEPNGVSENVVEKRLPDGAE
jgi:hypothetical protein